ncbi:MAG TPA: hypothetical protein VH331_12480 [Allosphingosinicella sp.]|jgi:hypothetical protein|nr:hypothetical protein [Allosphingosinicella sp.]
MRLATCGLVALATAMPAAASAAEFNATLATSLSSGRYGGAQTTDALVTAYGVQAGLNGWRLQMTFPQLQVSGGSGQRIVDGNIVSTGGRRRSGDGDMMLRIEHNLPVHTPVDLAMAVQFKLPTGARGLTTGGTDATLSVQASKTLGPVTPFASVGYQHVGDGNGLRLKDGWTASAGTMVTAGRTFFLLSYDTSHAIVPGAPARSVFALAGRPVGRGWSVSLYASKGLSAGAANLTTGIGLTRAFS